MECVFERTIIERPSSKHEGQRFQSLATAKLNNLALKSDIHSALATEKLDGMPCFVTGFEDKPYLWARLTLKLKEHAWKQFKEYLTANRGSGKGFTCNIEKDVENVKKALGKKWIPAHIGDNGEPEVNNYGTILGWVPVQKGDKDYKFHSSVVNYHAGAALVLRQSSEDEDLLEIAMVSLADLVGQTLELIGSTINANPYKLQKGMHILVAHGSLLVKNPPQLDMQQLRSWFEVSPEGQVEGIVWHCHDGTMFKLHNEHLELKWRNGMNKFLSTRPVCINVDGEGLTEHVQWQQHQQGSRCIKVKKMEKKMKIYTMDMLTVFSRVNGKHYSHLQDIVI